MLLNSNKRNQITNKSVLPSYQFYLVENIAIPFLINGTEIFLWTSFIDQMIGNQTVHIYNGIS
jgi:hypothetical protein